MKIFLDYFFNRYALCFCHDNVFKEIIVLKLLERAREEIRDGVVPNNE